jgi:tRNA-dihydrouridine synthase B
LVDFSKKVFALAPLAGYTDLPFRSIVKKFGADFTVSEMISSNALVNNSQKTLKMIEKSVNETPYSVQISGSDPFIIKDAVEILNDIEGIDCIDFNCGCPAPKVSHHGNGSGLLKDLHKMNKLIGIIKSNSNKQMTSVKTRIGFDTKIPKDIALAIEDSGADFVTVHGRTKTGGYKSVVDYDSIKTIKENCTIPVIANGDIKDLDTANWVLNHTKADGVMIGRGSIGNPWIFHQLKNSKDNISKDLQKKIIIEHFHSMLEFYGDFGVKLFRKHLHSYSKNIAKSSEFRQLINNQTDKNDVLKNIINFF